MNKLEPGELKIYCVLWLFIIIAIARFVGGF